MRETSEERIMKLLVPVDGSPASLRAAKLAIEIAAGRDQTTIILLNVQNIRTLALTEGAKAVMAIWLEEEERVSREALREAIAACEAAGILFSVRIERGKPAAMIHQIASEEAVDHIIMGTRGLGGIRGLLLGSVSSEVLRLAGDQPVTLVK
jgi:nucleotide-binding universal stress UspA family protein